MTITAKILADSISPQGIRLTTLQLRYPRFIHAEFMTHRMFSRNASSSRAIPVKRMIEDILRDPAMPMHWGKNESGMQAREQHTASVIMMDRIDGQAVSFSRENAWLEAMSRAIDAARDFHEAGYHKQIVNRLLEPFAHINVVVSSATWNNFFALRQHEDAQPEMRTLADAMWWAMRNSQSKLLKPGEWHLPYVTLADMMAYEDNNPAWIKLSVARCARVSYLTHEGKQPLPEQDLELYDRLIGSVPLHASPAEHQATPDGLTEGYEGPYGEWRVGGWQNAHQHGNFKGWRQYRKMLPNENQ